MILRLGGAAVVAAATLIAVPSVANAASRPDVILKSGSAVHINSRSFAWNSNADCFLSAEETDQVSVKGSRKQILTYTQVGGRMSNSAILGFGDAKDFEAGIELCPLKSGLGFSYGSVAIGPTGVWLDDDVDAASDSTYTDTSKATFTLKPDTSFKLGTSHKSGKVSISAALRTYQLNATGKASWAPTKKQSVTLYRKSGKKWVKVSTASTGTSGTAKFSFNAKNKYSYQVKYAGSSTAWSSASSVFAI